VLVQTLAPDAAAIRAAARHDSEGFLAAELDRRRALGYPPFSHLVRVELSGANPVALQADARRLTDALASSLPPATELLGPAPRLRLRGRHRRQLLLKGRDRPAIVAAVRATIEAFAADRALGASALSVDVDPQ
jgi:primosomal protein N' (replication factor Y)